MDVSTVTVVSFSPTGATRGVAKRLGSAIARGLGCELDICDFTLPALREARAFAADELVVLGMPTYAGRVPNKALPLLRELFSGAGGPCVPVVTYGGRAFDDALSELAGELRGMGLVPVAAAAVPCAHAFSDDIGAGRPSDEDLVGIMGLGYAVADALSRGLPLGELEVPGSWPASPYYTPLGTDGEPARFLKATPVTDLGACVDCGTCAKVCPMGTVRDGRPWDSLGICIKCQACVEACPTGARGFDDEAFLSHVEMLRRTVTGADDPLLLLAPAAGEGADDVARRLEAGRLRAAQERWHYVWDPAGERRWIENELDMAELLASLVGGE